MPLITKKIPVGPLETNCYIVSCEISGNTFIIDPGDSPKVISNHIFRNEFIPKAIILTHGHPDHLGALKILKGEFNIPLYMHRGDAGMVKFIGIDSAEKYLSDNDMLELGREKFRIIYTPGHSKGSICILGDGILFSGDTLFFQGVGRTDLPGGSNKELLDSLKNKLFTLPPETIVYPGHGRETTIGKETEGAG
jgi:glyoxylase-like metal-dependent hydrolase (beta-lactamase superfamily II)